MKATDTISVNPGKTALGHVDAPSSTIFRARILDEEQKTTQLDFTKFLFPSVNAGCSEYVKYSVPLRTLFATILIVTGITMLTIPSGLHGTAFAICTLCFGAFLGLGMFTRPVMAGAAIFYCISGALALRAGSADITVFSLMFGCVLFCITGAGKYSLDTLMKSSLLRHKRAEEIRRKDERLGYKAFHNVSF